MNKETYFRIPDSLFNDPLFYDARHSHQIIFLRMIRLAAFMPKQHDIRGNIITIQPGQLCYSLIKIAELSGKHSSKDDVEGTLKYFEKKCQFLLHEVLHRKSLITITHTDTYNLIVNNFPPTSPPRLLQDSSKTPPQIYKDNNDNNDDKVCVLKTMSFENEKLGSLEAAKKYKLNPEQVTSFRWLLQQEVNSSDETLSWYAKTYPFSRIKDVVFWAKREKRDNLGAYIRHLFNIDAVVETDLSKDNKQLALDYKISNKWHQLEIQEFYVICKKSENHFREIKLDIDSADFLNKLMDLHSWFEEL